MEASKFNGVAGNLSPSSSNGRSYFTFTPKKLPIELQIEDLELVNLLGRANLEIGNLNGMRNRVISPELLIRPYTTKEAVASSRIEGTKSSLDDVLMAEAKGETSAASGKPDDIEVINYITSQRSGLEKIRQGNLDLELILELHKILLTGVRGGNKQPGEIRTIQNFIGNYDTSNILDATYVPPEPEMVRELLENLFDYLNTEDRMPELIKIGIAHYQFEAIHPFRDGNGRIGRLLIILYLIKKGILEFPLLYISGYFERNREKYYDLLLKVSVEGGYVEWLKFFLGAIITQAKDAKDKEAKLVDYYNYQKERIQKHSRMRLLTTFELLFSYSYITISTAMEELGVTYPTARSAIMHLVNLGILAEVTGNKKNRVFAAKDIIKIIND